MALQNTKSRGFVLQVGRIKVPAAFTRLLYSRGRAQQKKEKGKKKKKNPSARDRLGDLSNRESQPGCQRAKKGGSQLSLAQPQPVPFSVLAGWLAGKSRQFAAA